MSDADMPQSEDFFETYRDIIQDEKHAAGASGNNLGGTS